MEQLRQSVAACLLDTIAAESMRGKGERMIQARFPDNIRYAIEHGRLFFDASMEVRQKLEASASIPDGKTRPSCVRCYKNECERLSLLARTLLPSQRT